MTLDGYKFDMRLYVLITGCDPLRIFLYQDGLVRLACVPYKPPKLSNLRNLHMHLTNYSVNKSHRNFEANEDDENTGHKRRLEVVYDHLAE